ncbi:hypothetical protein [Leifsonia virtsii]|uniref:Lipoprotein n=1 Tax=Leifsonia virtsii TaxID=3035915 RepID=A0ABT8J2G4_9MICO|nr:hypothetical protein [Leifsonia virtsii]MDN4598439.1 hypothetical protein [Leifsonia virtsii]
MKNRLLLAGVAALALALAGCSAPAGKPTPINEPRTVMQKAMSECQLISVSTGLKLGDENHTLILDGKGEEDAAGMSFDSELCVLKALKVTDAVLNEIETTRALDGRQEASWGKIDASWTYHPDNGLDITLTEK